MAGAGARTRKDGSASAKVGSIERLKPRQIGPLPPTIGQVRALHTAAAGARGAERRSLEARAESARQARSAHLTARGGEKRALAAAEAGAPRLNMANALGVTAEQHYSSLSSQRANWYAERMKVTDPIKRARITGLIKQYDAAMPVAHKAMMAEAAVKAAKPREPGLEHFVAQRVAAKAREAEGKAPKAPKSDADFNTARRTAKAAEKTAEGLRGELRAARAKGDGEAVTILAARVRAAEAHAAESKAKALAMVGPMAPMKVTRPAATHLTSEKNEYTGAQFHRVIHGPTGKGVPYMAFGRKDQGERAAAGTKSGKTIDRLINGTTEQKLRAGEAMRRYGRIIDGTKHHDTERHDYHRALAARKTKAAEAERVAKAEAKITARDKRIADRINPPKAAAKEAAAKAAQQAKDVAFLAARAKRHGIAFEHKDGNFHVEGRFGMQSHPLASQAKATMRNRMKQKIAGIRAGQAEARRVTAAKAVEHERQVAHSKAIEARDAAKNAKRAEVRAMKGEIDSRLTGAPLNRGIGSTIKVAEHGGKTRDVPVLHANGNFALHHGLEAGGLNTKSFTVTHGPSGLALGGLVPTIRSKTEGKKVLETLNHPDVKAAMDHAVANRNAKAVAALRSTFNRVQHDAQMGSLQRRVAAKPSVPEATANKARALGATSIRGGKVAFHPNAWERHNEFKSHLEKEGVPFRVKHTGTFVLG